MYLEMSGCHNSDVNKPAVTGRERRHSPKQRNKLKADFPGDPGVMLVVLLLTVICCYLRDSLSATCQNMRIEVRS